MKVIKSQSLLFQNAPTQIGNQAMMGFSVGYAFRLSDPRILVHEANVWAAINSAPSSVPLCQLSMPKKYAEWVLAGHSVSSPSNAGYRGNDWEWAANVRLGNTSKTVSCKSRVDADGIARLSMDQASAAVNAHHIGVNPAKEASLMLMGKLGAGADSAAAMTPIDQRWPERQQWMPKFGNSPKAMADDGTHMGWPQKTDLRLFQQANANQWASNDEWQHNVSYALHGFGRHGGSFEGVIPEVNPKVLVCEVNHGIQKYHDVKLKLQTVWFMPDADVCVLWWYGSLPLTYVLDAPFSYAACALQSEGSLVTDSRLKEIAEVRLNYESEEIYLNSDFPMMPPVGGGLVWELISNSKDHPNASPDAKTYEQIAEDLQNKHVEILDIDQELKRELIKAKESQDNAAADFSRANSWATGYASSKPGIQGPSWVEYLSRKPAADKLQVLSDQTIKDQDFTDTVFFGWHMERVVFERCRFSKVSIKNCQFDRVDFLNCDFQNANMLDVSWSKGNVSKGKIVGCDWQQVKLEDVSVSELDSLNWKYISCHLLGVVFDSGSHVGMIMDDCDGDDLSYHALSMKDAYWKKARISNIGVIGADFSGLLVTESNLEKFSVVDGNFSRAKVHQSTVNSFSVVKRSSLADAEFSESTIINGCWIGVDASGISVKRSLMKQLNAEGAALTASRWTYSLLSGSHFHKANLSDSKWNYSALNDANLSGADISDAEFKDCNMVGANMAWINEPGVRSFLSTGNLIDGANFFPRRS